ncbi:major facilitator superfamily domain-containing protein [Talaromyces proteolyticus]|uniref:Major facilitator superfamily domain-containing protein n=1 Tax=Talaromyces proteolyticus TaxID=1131652 RepID=A0AAD4PVG3_9EURO|nr:major facilitator superfamily domain-containing protein [Talaromyces proteolyticus]KAH8691328.1 major facilitator superfamily domain-containing protein [Talaromyces proteolyticus]
MTKEGIKRAHPAITTIGFGGTQAVFSLISGQAVTHLQALGLHPTEVTLTLLLGPICGVIFQPYFGSWSDQCQSPWGRRKPFIVMGTVFLIFSILSLAWADTILKMFIQNHEVKDGSYRTIFVIFTILLAFSMFVAIQAVQVGLRASITDNNTPSEQAELNAWAGLHSNFAAVVGNLAAFVDLPKYIHRFGKTVFADTSLLMTVYLVITIVITCWYIHEEDDVPTSRQFISSRRRREFFSVMQSVFFGKPNQIKNICIVQFFSWLGWFPFLFYVVTYVNSLQKSHTIIINDIGALTPLAYTTVSFFVAIILPHHSSTIHIPVPRIIKSAKLWPIQVTPRIIWTLSQLIFAVSMLGTLLVDSAIGTIFLFAMVGISWAVSCRIPYSLLGDELSRPSTYNLFSGGGLTGISDSQGLLHGIHNMAICLPQIVVMSLMGIIWSFVGSDDAFVGVVWFLRLGGAVAFVAMGFSTTLHELDHHEGDMENTVVLLEERDSEALNERETNKPHGQEETVSEPDDIHQQIPLRTKTPIWIYFLIIILIISNTISILTLSWGERPEQEKDVPSPEDYAIPPKIPTVYKPFWWNTEYSNKNKTRQDELWNEVFWEHGLIAVDRDWAKSQNWPETIALPGNDSKTVFLIEAYHEVVMCNADSHPLYTFGGTYVGYGQQHKCKDWSALRDYATEHTACYKEQSKSFKENFGGDCHNGDGLIIDSRREEE